MGFATAGHAQGAIREKIKQRLLERMQRRETPVPSGSKLINLEHDGRKRYYLIHVPPQYDRTQQLSLVLVFHGGGGNPAQIERQVGFDQMADKDGVIVVYPGGSSPNFKDKFLTWNTLLCNTYADNENIDDISFVLDVIEDVRSKYRIDPRKVYATGMSQGAMMSYRLACEASDKIAAIGPVSGAHITANCHPSRPVSVISFSGMKDARVLYDGGAGPSDLHVVGAVDSAPAIASFWAKHNGLSLNPSLEKRIGRAHALVYGPGPSGTEVVFWTLEDGGHRWPGVSPENQKFHLKQEPANMDVDAPQLIWEFFKKHSR